MEEQGMFNDDDIMIFPESIDNIEPSKTSYMFSTTKLIFMFLGLLPVFILSIMILSEFGIVPTAVFAGLYMIIYFYCVRVYVIEEPKQRESLNQLEDNKVSEYSYFWNITKVGTGAKDDGLLYLTQDGLSLRRAYVIKFDSGSIVGVPENYLNNFRETEKEFLRNLGMSFRWFSIQKKPQLNESLKNQSNNLVNIENEALNKLIKMQLNGYLRYSMDAEQRYVNYIMVINNQFDKLSSFKNTLQDNINRTLKTNASFKNVEVLNKEGLDEFFATYYMQDVDDIASIRKTNDTKPFAQYAKVISVIDGDNKVVPLEAIDLINAENAKYSGGITVDAVYEKEATNDLNRELMRQRQYKQAQEKLKVRRRKDEITFEQYKEMAMQLAEDYTPENFIPNREDTLKEREKERIRQEKIAKRQEDRERKEEEKRLAEQAPAKWFEEGYIPDESDEIQVLDTNASTEDEEIQDYTFGQILDAMEKEDYDSSPDEDDTDFDDDDVNIFDLFEDEDE